MVFRAIGTPTIDIYIKSSEAVKLFIARVTAVWWRANLLARTDRQTYILFGGSGVVVVDDGDDGCGGGGGGDDVVGLFGKVWSTHINICFRVWRKLLLELVQGVTEVNDRIYELLHMWCELPSTRVVFVWALIKSMQIVYRHTRPRYQKYPSVED